MEKNQTNLDEILEPYLVQDKIKSLLTGSHLSDVSFLIEGELIYAHKLILSLASPVFEKMFYGDLKMQSNDPIPVTDLTAIGFKNLLKFVYTNQIDLELSELYETYLAADKYLVHHMIKASIDYLKLKLDVSNCCLIYDQILKIETINSSALIKSSIRNDVEKMISSNAKKAFKSDHFTKIEQTTLISLLNFDKLNISETDLLKACWRYVNANVLDSGNDLNQKNKRKFFKQFKNLIRFDDLNPKELAFKGLLDLFNETEVAFLFLHLHNREIPSNLECLTKRMNCSISSVFYSCANYRVLYTQNMRTLFKVNQKVDIKSIYSTIPSSYKDFDLFVLDTKLIDLKLKIQKFVINDKWMFEFESFEINPNINYTLDFKNKETNNVTLMSTQKTNEFKMDQKCISFLLDFQFHGFSYHYVEKIDFLIL